MAAKRSQITYPLHLVTDTHGPVGIADATGKAVAWFSEASQRTHGYVWKPEDKFQVDPDEEVGTTYYSQRNKLVRDVLEFLNGQEPKSIQVKTVQYDHTRWQKYLKENYPHYKYSCACDHCCSARNSYDAWKAAESSVTPLPSGMTRQECVDGLKECRNMAVEAEKARDKEGTFKRWPDLDALLDYIEKYGFPPSEKS